MNFFFFGCAGRLSNKNVCIYATRERENSSARATTIIISLSCDARLWQGHGSLFLISRSYLAVVVGPFFDLINFNIFFLSINNNYFVLKKSHNNYYKNIFLHRRRVNLIN